jgi:transcriptional regulator with XRE-family HTH domain
MKLFAQNLVRLRKSAALTQEALADRSGLATAHLSQIETGRRWPRPGTIEALAKGLGAPVAELFRDDSLNPTETTPEQAVSILSDFIARVKKK